MPHFTRPPRCTGRSNATVRGRAAAARFLDDSDDNGVARCDR
eukprot:CAMPEP_0194676200 /NCGR_PEP_ID=MMETSP0295-20121207/8729_1 /TAXON_ID=39354 /ORGANISM="Heterosigma akashiwo, Strain CCMP2393" /LENGTH=41 /DNA_ID= /DNA_START= /DNA_END= /DNA_ORIENTATION=